MVFKPQKLTYKGVIAKARKAYEEKRLGGQIRGNTNCLYDYGNNRHCAIGVALSKKTLAKIHRHDKKENDGLELNEAVLHTLVKYDIVTVDRGDFEALLVLQDTHDKWCRKSGTFEHVYVGREFKKLLYGEKTSIKKLSS